MKREIYQKPCRSPISRPVNDYDTLQRDYYWILHASKFNPTLSETAFLQKSISLIMQAEIGFSILIDATRRQE